MIGHEVLLVGGEVSNDRIYNIHLTDMEIARPDYAMDKLFFNGK